MYIKNFSKINIYKNKLFKIILLYIYIAINEYQTNFIKRRPTNSTK